MTLYQRQYAYQMGKSTALYNLVRILEGTFNNKGPFDHNTLN